MHLSSCFLFASDNYLHALTEEEDDVVISGWGDVEGMREELLKDWGDILERWDGKERGRPSKVIKLCRKVSDHSRLTTQQLM